MAPKHWNKSHFLTILLRCRIATWSVIFLKTTEIHQKSALQWKYHHFQQKYFSAAAAPRPLFSKCSLLLLPIYFTGSGRQPGRCLLAWRLLPARRVMLGCLYCIPRDTPSHFWRDGIAQSVVSAPAMAWRYEKGLWENCSKAPPWREKRFKKREQKVANFCCCVKGGSESRFNSRALEFNGKIPLASEKKKKNQTKSTTTFQSSMDICQYNTWHGRAKKSKDHPFS